MGRGYQIPQEHIAKSGFHGAARDMVGGVVQPSSAGHQPVFDGLSDPGSTYFTPTGNEGDPVAQELNGWRWAQSATSPGFGTPKDRLRPRVFVTEPHPDQHIDKNIHGSREPDLYGMHNNERVAPSQRVLDTNWGPPPQHWQSHVEQTLPHIAWRQFGGVNWLAHKPDGASEDDRGMSVAPNRGYRERQTEREQQASVQRTNRPMQGQEKIPGTEHL